MVRMIADDCRAGWGFFMRRLFCVVAALGFVVLATSGPAAAAIVVHVDRVSERMQVVVDGAPRYNWRVSTARRGYITPPGIYHPQRLAVRWYSKKYDNAPMPHSIFFHGGYAIHGTYEISGLGRPVSHGCVRLDPANAAILYGLVERQGFVGTTIMVH
jgi:lipoprotein-anchoring transpeptidase ErfK/SrfK